MPGRVALIDGDIVAYRAAHASTTEIDWDGNGDIVSDSDPRVMQAALDKVIADWTKLVKCDRPVIAMSSRAKTGHRYRVHPHYKQSRTGDKPVNLSDAMRSLRDRYDCRSFPGLEGDDVIGIMATRDPDKCVVVSTDKDMLTLPSRVCIIPHRKPLSEARKFHLTEAEADRNWFLQAISGDSIDNYRGAPGIGRTGAEQFLVDAQSVEQLWERTVAAFGEAWTMRRRFRDKWVYPADPRSEALMSVRVARILRDGDYVDGWVRLWAPEGDAIERVKVGGE